MQDQPQKKIGPAAFAAAGLFGTAAAFLLLFGLGGRPAPLLLTAALLFAVAGLLFLRRYLFTDFLYRLSPGDASQGVRLSFYQINGKTSRRLGSIPLSDCEALLSLSDRSRAARSKRRAAKKGRRLRGDLRTNFASPNASLLLYQEDHCPCYLLFEPSPAFADLLKKFMGEK